MILNKNLYRNVSLFKSWWIRQQIRKIKGEKLFKTFKLHKTEWPDRLYFYSPRLKKRARFIATPEQLSLWQDSKLCETLCPTQAIKVTADAIIIDDRGCIGCGLCVEFAPPGILEMNS
jgi:ferredoxin